MTLKIFVAIHEVDHTVPPNVVEYAQKAFVFYSPEDILWSEENTLRLAKLLNINFDFRTNEYLSVVEIGLDNIPIFLPEQFS